jgi:hypothetical protein
MPETPGEKSKIIVDSDWKAEAQKEKERLSQEVDDVEGGPIPPPSFPELVQMILIQAMAGFGGYQTPDGQTVPPELEVAKHYIDLLALLGEKTKGNLTDDEKKLMGAALYELQMRFVQVSGAAPPAAGARPAQA